MRWLLLLPQLMPLLLMLLMLNVVAAAEVGVEGGGVGVAGV